MKKIIIAALLLVSMQGFGQTKSDKNTVNVVAKKDTTVKPVPIYFIAGTEEDFNLLMLVIADRDNTTANQQKSVLQWIATKKQVPIDSLNKK